MALSGPFTYNASILTRKGMAICGAECHISVDKQTGEISDVGILIPKDNDSFREHVTDDRHLILVLPEHPPYNITMDTVHGLHGGLFKIERAA